MGIAQKVCFCCIILIILPHRFTCHRRGPHHPPDKHSEPDGPASCARASMEELYSKVAEITISCNSTASLGLRLSKYPDKVACYNHYFIFNLRLKTSLAVGPLGTMGSCGTLYFANFRDSAKKRRQHQCGGHTNGECKRILSAQNDVKQL